MLKGIFYLIVLVFSGNALAVVGFNGLRNDSEAFVRSTCGGFASNGTSNSLEADLFATCGSMVESVNGLPGRSGPTVKNRALSVDELAGGFQNMVPEETLAATSISANTSSLNISTINSRLAKIRFGGGSGDDLFSSTRIGFFINGIGGFGVTDQTNEMNASDFETKGVISGFDYKVTENLIVGLAGSYSNFELDFNQNSNVSGGGIDSDSYSVTAYSNYAVGNAYVEGVFSYGWSEYEIDRRIVIGSNTAVAAIDRTANANPDGEQFSVSLAGGYDFHTEGFSYGPYARVAYFESTIDGYDETGAAGLNLRVGEHKSDSLESVLGLQMTHAFSQSFGVLIPHVKAEWHHEFKNSQRYFDISYVNDPRSNIYRSGTGNPDRNFFNVSAGLSADLKYGFQTFFNYETILGLDNIDAHKFSAGLRMEF